MTSTTSTATKSMLYEIYLVVVAFPKWFPIMDHSSLQVSFTEQFCRSNGIMHRTSAAYKPSTNGQAEPVVQIQIAQARVTKHDVNVVLARSHLAYRNTPHTTTGEAPSVCFFVSCKDKTPEELQSSIVYKFSCPGCSKSYIGKTDRCLYTRLNVSTNMQKWTNTVRFRNTSTIANTSPTSPTY